MITSLKPGLRRKNSILMFSPECVISPLNLILIIFLPICTRLNESNTEGFCTNTISNVEYSLTGAEWQKVLSESLVLPVNSFKEFKIYILKACKESNQCKELELKNKIKQFEQRANR